MTMHFMIRILPILSMIGMLCTHTPTVHALSMTPYSLSELWSESQLIVRGKVVKARPHRERGRIFTEFTLSPVGPLFKGELSADQVIRFSLPGGQLDGLAQRVPGIPTIYTGEELLLFLRCTSSTSCSPVGYGQGMWRPLKNSWEPLTRDVHWVGASSPLTIQSLERLTSPR